MIPSIKASSHHGYRGSWFSPFPSRVPDPVTTHMTENNRLRQRAAGWSSTRLFERPDPHTDKTPEEHARDRSFWEKRTYWRLNRSSVWSPSGSTRDCAAYYPYSEYALNFVCRMNKLLTAWLRKNTSKWIYPSTCIVWWDPEWTQTDEHIDRHASCFNRKQVCLMLWPIKHKMKRPGHSLPQNQHRYMSYIKTIKHI